MHLFCIPIGHHASRVALQVHAVESHPAYSVLQTSWKPQIYILGTPCSRGDLQFPRIIGRITEFLKQSVQVTVLLLIDERALNVDGEAVVHIVLDQAFHGSVHVVNWDLLDIAFDALLPAEVQHLLRLLNATDQAPANGQPAQQHLGQSDRQVVAVWSKVSWSNAKTYYQAIDEQAWQAQRLTVLRKKYVGCMVK